MQLPVRMRQLHRNALHNNILMSHKHTHTHTCVHTQVDEDGKIYREWAGRSVIASRAKLAYPMVQQMIEGCFDPAPWGVQLHEGATWEEVRETRAQRACRQQPRSPACFLPVGCLLTHTWSSIA